jgi:hypothetical protein
MWLFTTALFIFKNINYSLGSGSDPPRLFDGNTLLGSKTYCTSIEINFHKLRGGIKESYDIRSLPAS